MEIRTTLCNRDCPDVCRIVATVQDGRVTQLRGDPAHPVTRGFLCYRTGHFLERQYAPDRLTAPLLRTDGELRPVSWEHALDVAAARLVRIRDESGAAAIFHYRSGGSLGLLKVLSDYFFEKFGPVTIKRGDICSGAGEAAQELDFGISESNDLFDLERARNIFLWGKNVAVSSPHTIPVLRRAKKAGAELVLIDPVYHKTAALCDVVVQPRPGGDFALAMAVAQVLFGNGWIDPDAREYCDHLDAFRAVTERRSLQAWCELADVPPSVALDLARRLGPGKPTAILVGWGMGRRNHGGAIVRALDALGAVSGNLGISGGGVSFYYRRRGAFDLSFVRGQRVAPRTLAEPLFGPAMLAATDPPIRAVWVTAGNPVAMLPESETTARALASREFVVVVDSFLTDTARLAHLVLPTTTLLEDDDLLGSYGHHYLGASTPVVRPHGGAKSDLEIIQALAGRVGLGEALAGSARDWKRRLLSPELKQRGVTLEALERDVVRNPNAATLLFADRKFFTPSHKVNLLADEPSGFAGAAARGDADYPLLLLSLSTPRSQASQWAKEQAGPAPVTVHPRAVPGLPHGARALLQSRVSSMEVRVVHDDRQRRDVALLPKGGHRAAGQCANALIRAALTDLGEGGALYDERVRIVPLAP